MFLCLVISRQSEVIRGKLLVSRWSLCTQSLAKEKRILYKIRGQDVQIDSKQIKETCFDELTNSGQKHFLGTKIEIMKRNDNCRMLSLFLSSCIPLNPMSSFFIFGIFTRLTNFVYSKQSIMLIKLSHVQLFTVFRW